MSTSRQIESNHHGTNGAPSARVFVKRILGSVGAREVGIFLGFCLLTVLMTWPWILHLRDAVADKGDPYMIAWTLWWDFHQTFHNPLHLFDANVFYPYRYTLAFSENDYGIALLFFPLFGLGLRPLTVSAIATFLGFVFSGYGSFRLTRTLTGSKASAWLAGIIFAFIPYRFHLLSHLHYLFAGWIPLLCEALILFFRKPTWGRASWLGAAFLMNALSCVSWFLMTLIPLGLTFSVLLVANKERMRDRQLWIRGAVAIGCALVLFSPFLITYYRVSVLYGLRWQPWEFAFNSASPIHWLKSDPRNKLWHRMGESISSGHMLFPGLFAPLLAIAALRLKGSKKKDAMSLMKRRVIIGLDIVIILAAVVAVIALGYGAWNFTFFGRRILRLDEKSVRHALIIIIVAVVVRLAFTLPSITTRLRQGFNRAGETNRLQHGLPILIGSVWMVWGFLASLGANVFLVRWLHDYLLLFQSIRIPSRAAMICYVGLAVLGGIGGAQIANRIQGFFRRRHAGTITLLLIAAACLFELRAAPLQVEKGEVDTSALAQRLLRTQMKGGLVELPSDPSMHRDFYMLRAADHERPLVNATSSFISPVTDKINQATNGKIDAKFIDLLEQIPASYLAIHNDRLLPVQRVDYESFLARQIVSGRLRFINRFDGHDYLYAVVKNEPGAKSEAAPPFQISIYDWGDKIREDPVNLLARPLESQLLYRVLLAESGKLPQYAQFLTRLESVAMGVKLGSDEETNQFEQNLKRFLDERRDETVSADLDDEKYVDRLITNAGINLDSTERTNLIQLLFSRQETRAGVLVKIANHPRFIEKENERSLLLLHYFGYLRRNPGDPPDRDLRGFNFWLQDLGVSHDTKKLPFAFGNSIEYQNIRKRK
jgi:hypothetical protein